MFGMVLQDTWLFNGTIMENLRYGRLDDEEVKRAATAHVDSFIKTLPDGYNMELKEASNMSQGQKQLTIARAILADLKYLFLMRPQVLLIQGQNYLYKKLWIN